MEWYQKDKEQILEEVGSNEHGLSTKERSEALQEYGPNILTKTKQDSEIKKFLRQFNDLLIYVLIISGILKGLVGAYLDMTIILLVVIVNGLIGYIQERKATTSLNSLTAMLSTEAMVIVDGEKELVEAATLVKGDIVVLSAGNIIPADLRIIEAFSLVVEEAILTGESSPVDKNNLTIDAEVGLGDRLNMVYSGTLVNSGSALGVVVETGDNTELGKISQHLSSVGATETPLIRKINQLNKQIFYFLAALMVFLFFIGFFYRDFTTVELLSALVALAVSAVPEGLPAVLSIILSVGVTRMAKKKAIIKKMPAVETLGSMNVICSDKTGTLTKNEMKVLTIITKDEVVELDSNASPFKQINLDDSHEASLRLAQIALYCNDTKISYEDGKKLVVGNPTEGALLELANRVVMNEEAHVLYKIPFDSAYKYMAAVTKVDGESYIFLKGAPDVILNMVDFQLENRKEVPLTSEYWERSMKEYASKGQRMLAGAYKKIDTSKKELTHEELHQGMVLTGIYGIIDPPKREAIDAVKICHDAGISVKMITGDHKDTAMAIAKQIGLTYTDHALVGSELEVMSDDELKVAVAKTDVYARTTPEHKLRIVTALQANKQIVGMTGDGVNDAPALKKADIGIAMGIKGTQVTKDVADMVLADDNFASISQAVQVGRHVYDNLKKTIYFLIPTAFAQGLLVVVSILVNIPLPLTSVQILWLNMVSTITLSFALGFEPLAKDAMNKPPRDINENILNGYAVFRITYVSILIAFFGFLVNSTLKSAGASQLVMQTTLMQTLVFGQLFYMINCREFFKFSINKEIFQNKVLWISIATLFLLQLMVLTVPIVSSALGTTRIGLNNLWLSFIAGIGVYIIVEIEKAISRKILKK